MYAIIQDRGKQYQVREGDVLWLDHLSASEGEEVVFDKILYLRKGDEVNVGRPFVDGAKVRAKVTKKEVKGDKIHVYKFKRRKGYKRKHGYRHLYTEVKVLAIEG